MKNIIAGSLVEIDESTTRNTKTQVKQLVDIVQADIFSTSDNNTIKKYQVFVTGGLNQTAVTSSLYQTVFDQDHTLATSNEMLDMTVGIWEGDGTTAGRSQTVQDASGTYDSHGKLSFSSDTLMMREKLNIYRQYALNLLGSSTSAFTTPFDLDAADFTTGAYGGTRVTQRIEEALFINVKRLFTRDNILKESFAFRIYKDTVNLSATVEQNLFIDSNSFQTPAASTFVTIADKGAKSNRRVSAVGGEVGTLKNVSESGDPDVGLIFYDLGIAVLDLKRLFLWNQPLRGLITSVNATASTVTSTSPFGDPISVTAGQSLLGTASAGANFIPNFVVSGSIDDILDHLRKSRFGAANLTAMAFQNGTFVNSSILTCSASPSQLNYSTNPTYKKSDGSLRVVEDDDDVAFSYVTTIGLHDAEGRLLAVAKTSRPIEKNLETELSIRIRLDY